MRSSILVTSAAALLSVAAAATAVTEPGIDWPVAPSARIVSAVQIGAGDGGDIDWPALLATPIGTRGGETGVIDRA